MKQIVSTLLIFTCTFGTQASFAQIAKSIISGRIIDQSKKPTPDANVTLLRQEDGTVAGGDVTGDDGSYTIEVANAGKYKLRINALGFGDKIIEEIDIAVIGSNKKMSDITLSKSETTLKGVEIVKERNLLEMSIDKKTFNVDKNITSAGGSAADMLQNVPSVTVDADGNVSLRGKSNVTILIDGRPATLMGGDVASALQSLPAASVESVEVITNPSSKYDAQGSTGILNIITKKDKNIGLNGSATLGIGTRDKYNGGINMNLKNDKWNFSLNSNFRDNNNYNRGTVSRKNLFSDTSSFTKSDYQRQFFGWFNALTAEYTINKNNTISLTQNVNIMRFGSKGNATYNLYDAPSDIYNYQDRYEKFTGGPTTTSTNLNYKHKFKKPKQELTADVTYAIANSTHEQTLTSNTYDHNGNLQYGPELQSIPSTGGNNSINAQVDYSTPFLTKEGKLEAGVKTQNFWFNSANNPVITVPGQTPVFDTFLHSAYKYNQQTHAAYVSFNDQQKKWSYQAGLRLEYAGYSGEASNVTSQNYSNNFVNLFPSAYLAYQIDKSQQVYLNYTKRTNRPFFMQMIPYLNVANALDTTSGNPNLKPEFIDNFELAYNAQLPKSTNLIASIYYQRITNLIQNYTRPYADGTSFSEPVNLSYGTTYGLELTGRTQITKAWDATLSCNFFQNKIMGSNIDPSINNSGFSWFSKLNTNYKLSKAISVQLMGNYESAKPAAQGTLKEVYWIDAAIKATFMKNKASITFNVSDIFNTRKYTTVYNLALYDQTSYRNRETQIATITFTYKFGKSDAGNKMFGSGKRSKQNNSDSPKKESKERDSNLKSGDDDNSGGGNGGGMQK
jgi:iron complex outermembrane recepter protein